MTEARAASGLAPAMPLVRDLLAESADESGHVVAVGDAAGRLLWVEGSSRVRDRVDDMGFAEGALWSETAVGTNAPGTALALGRPVQIASAEHFVAAVQRWSCTAVPIRNPTTGTLLGVLDVTGGPQAATATAMAMVRATVAAIEATLAPLMNTAVSAEQIAAPGWLLAVLGRTRAELRTDRGTTVLSPRHSELMLLLALHPRGLSADRLAVFLSDDTIPSVTIRAELARLRQLLGADQLLSRPYRLASAPQVDAVDLAAALDRGGLDTALTDYPGPVLPDSDAPAIVEFREEVSARVRAAAMRTTNADALLAYASTAEGGNDAGVLRALLAVTAPTSPRRPAVQARLAVLERRYA